MAVVLALPASAGRVQRKVVAKALGVHVRDLRVVEASVFADPGRAPAVLIELLEARHRKLPDDIVIIVAQIR